MTLRVVIVLTSVLFATSVSAEEAPPKTGSKEWGVDGPYVLDTHLLIGGGGRLDSPPLYAADRVGGLLLGGGMGLSLSRRIGIGASYTFMDLGSEESNVLAGGVVNISRALHTGWLQLEAYPVREDVFGFYLSLGAGLSGQTATLSGSLWAPATPGNSIEVRCDGSTGPGFAFRGAAGIDAVLPSGFMFMLEGGLENHRLSDEVFSNCVPGAGTATVLAIRTGLGYAWDL